MQASRNLATYARPTSRGDQGLLTFIKNYLSKRKSSSLKTCLHLSMIFNGYLFFLVLIIMGELKKDVPYLKYRALKSSIF